MTFDYRGPLGSYIQSLLFLFLPFLIIFQKLDFPFPQEKVAKKPPRRVAVEGGVPGEVALHGSSAQGLWELATAYVSSSKCASSSEPHFPYL